MGYKTPEAHEMAVTATSRASSMDTGRAAAASTSIACCVVCSAAQALLPPKGAEHACSHHRRTGDARHRHPYRRSHPGAGAGRAERARFLDLGDYVTFEYADAESIKAEDE